MRMWMVNPRTMCRRHLLGEHVEIHMLAGSLQRGRSVAGHLAAGQLEPAAMNTRHRVLADEILRRGWKHASPLPPIGRLPHEMTMARVDVIRSLAELRRRCPECAAGTA
jgi:hypothetical protein